MSRAIVTVAVGAPFVEYARELLDGARKFGCAECVSAFMDVWPPGSPSHQEHHYAFKYFAIRAALEAGYRKVLWLDSQAQVAEPLEGAWAVVERDGYLLCNDGSPLYRWISDAALVHFGVTRDEIRGVSVLAGTVIGLDLDNPRSRSFFDEWGKLACVRGGLFMSSHSKAVPGRMRSLSVSYGSGEPISQDPEVLGHRADEACLTLMARARGMSVNYELGGAIRTDVVPDVTERDFFVTGGRIIDRKRLSAEGWSLIACDRVEVPGRGWRKKIRSIEDVHSAMEMFKTRQLDLVVLDDQIIWDVRDNVDVLRSWPGQISRQISCGRIPPDDICAHLGKWYDVVYAGPDGVLFHSRGRIR